MFSFSPIATVHSCYRTKFGIPRQSGLIPEATGWLELLPPYNQPNTVRGLEAFSHIWVIFVFNENLREGWKATVRPPRLGGDRRLGVFATRSPFRPMPIGLSAMKLEGVEIRPRGKILLRVSGLDLVDGTPVLDIKPYLPYTDSIPQATGGFADAPPPEVALQVKVAPELLAAMGQRHPELLALARKVVAADPRPAYQRIPGREYQCYLEDWEVLWTVDEDPTQATITRIHPWKKPRPPATPSPSSPQRLDDDARTLGNPYGRS